jgi:hypothetical protein
MPPLPRLGMTVAMSGTSLIDAGNVEAFGYETSWRVNARSRRLETV